jgi:hypothetical protein
MKVACPTCARVLTVPPDKVKVPRLKARCPCGIEFAVTGPAALPIGARLAVAEAPAIASAPVVIAPVAVARTPAAATPPPAEPPRRPIRPAPWPRCSNHPQSRSSFVCPKCVAGYCDACVQKVQGGAICAACDGLCTTTALYSDRQTTAQQRGRSMADEIAVIVGYPFRDPLAFVLLAVFTWVFGYFAPFLAQGVLMLYTFHALTRVSSGDLKSTMPDFTDVFDLMLPARLAIAAFVISTGPLILVVLLVPGAHLALYGSAPPARDVVHAAGQPAPSAAEDDATGEESPAPEDDDDEDAEDDHASGAARNHRPWREETKTGALAVGLLALTMFWKLAYTPVALTVAALSRSYLSTLNPVIGIGTIGRMGITYWHAMVIYTVLALLQWGFGFGLDKIPLAGPLIRSFTDAYAQLAIACTLGLAVFKKAAALGWD